jgi:predicted RND superfamily exporter protein
MVLAAQHQHLRIFYNISYSGSSRNKLKKKKESSKNNLKMEFWSLFMVASMPVLQVLIICLLGSFIASSRINVLTTEALTNMNKVKNMFFLNSG